MKFDLHYLLSAKYAQWISVALVFLFSMLIIIEFSTLHFSPGNVPIVPVAEQQVPVVAKDDSFKSVLQSSLFGVYTPPVAQAVVKQSQLNVTLVGILFSDKLSDSQVILRASGAEEKTYSIGDLIAGEAIIKRIMAEGVLIERNGALESLSLPKNELTFEPVAKPLNEE